MNNTEQVIQLVEKFLAVAKELLDNGKIDDNIYNQLTANKKSFLQRIKEEYHSL